MYSGQDSQKRHDLCRALFVEGAVKIDILSWSDKTAGERRTQTEAVVAGSVWRRGATA